MKKKVALVLSSGSSRGLASIGAIEALEENGYEISSVAGCSMGAIVGGMYAAGKLKELKEWYMQMTLKRMWELSDFTLSTSYLLHGERIIQALSELIPDYKIEDLRMPLALIATDMQTGREIVFRSGSLSHAIRASFSIPLVLEPVRDGKMLLMDGGITNALPLNRVARTEGDILVSVNVSAPDLPRKEEEKQEPSWLERMLEQRNLKPTMFKRGTGAERLGYAALMNKVNDIMIQQHCELIKQLCPPDINIDIAMNQFGMFEYDHAETIIAFGKEKMQAAIAEYEAKAMRS